MSPPLETLLHVMHSKFTQAALKVLISMNQLLLYRVWFHRFNLKDDGYQRL
jgi:hypothetical protein